MSIRSTPLLGVLLCFAAGCSSSSGNGVGNPFPDMTAAPDLVSPKGQVDMTLAGDMALPLAGDMAFAGPMPNLVLGGNYTVDGVTDDGYAIVHDAKNEVAVKLTDGSKLTIGISDASAFPVVLGKVVFLYNGIDTNRTGALTVWTAAGGSKMVAAAASGYVQAVNADGTYVAYSDGLSAMATGGTLIVDKADHSAPHGLGTPLDLVACFPTVRFAGSRLVASHCPPMSAVATVTSYDPATGTPMDILPSASNLWEQNLAATLVQVKTAANVASVMSPIGQNPVQLDTGFGNGAFTADGTSVVYSTVSGGLSRVGVDGMNKKSLLMSGVGAVRGVSADAMWALYDAAFDNMTGFSKMYLASAVNAGAPVTLSSKVDTGIYGDPFTADSAFALYSSPVDPNSQVGPLLAQPVGGGQPAKLASTVWVWLTGGGGKLVYNDNFQMGGDNGLGDVYYVDVSAGTKALQLAVGADVNIYLTRDKKTLVYTVPNMGILTTLLP